MSRDERYCGRFGAYTYVDHIPSNACLWEMEDLNYIHDGI